MKLWHQDLVSHLPKNILLEQYRLCCRLRGTEWGSTDSYIFNYSPYRLVRYHRLIIKHLLRKRFTKSSVNLIWDMPKYRGVDCKPWRSEELFILEYIPDEPIYPEQDEEYFQKDLERLKELGVSINMGRINRWRSTSKKRSIA